MPDPTNCIFLSFFLARLWALNQASLFLAPSKIAKWLKPLQFQSRFVLFLLSCLERVISPSGRHFHTSDSILDFYDFAFAVGRQSF